MRIMINDPVGRMSGMVVGETLGVDYDVYFKFRDLDGKTGQETIPVLQEAVEKISTNTENDYENRIRERMIDILSNLLNLAREHPDGIWRVS